MPASNEQVNELIDICKCCQQPIFAKAQPVITVGTVTVDPNTRLTRHDGKLVKLTSAEFRVLYLLAQRSPQPTSRDTIFNLVWPVESEVDTQIIDVLVCKIRKKMGWSAKGSPLMNVWGRGYSLLSEVPN
jgi:DNA-binding response OmpR family regulator